MGTPITFLVVFRIVPLVARSSDAHAPAFVALTQETHDTLCIVIPPLRADSVSSHSLSHYDTIDTRTSRLILSIHVLLDSSGLLLPHAQAQDDRGV